MLNIAVIKILLYKIYNLMTILRTLFTKSLIIIYGWVYQDTYFRDCVYLSDIEIGGNLGHVYHIKDFQNQPLLEWLSVMPIADLGGCLHLAKSTWSINGAALVICLIICPREQKSLRDFEEGVSPS